MESSLYDLGVRVPLATRPSVQVRIERGRFLIKTADQGPELEEALRLRHEVFYREFNKAPHPLGIDVDLYDTICDHLVILDQSAPEPKVVGTYRLISSGFSDVFYSQSEFDLTDFMRLPGVKLEMGRACVHEAYRSGAVVSLLWRGILDYAQKVNAQYLFGCSSVLTTDLRTSRLISRLIQVRIEAGQEFVAFPRVKPAADYRLPGWDDEAHLDLAAVSVDELLEARAKIPSLLKTYLNAGAKVGLEPALDTDFNCIDFFTILPLRRLTTAFEGRFQ